MKILVAGVGNVFLGDDAFGVEVARRLVATPLEGVVVRDFGIRAFDLAMAISGFDHVVLVDATMRGGTPGTLYLIELSPDASGPEAVEVHSLTPEGVVRTARLLGCEKIPPLHLVGCEPLELGTDDDPRGTLSAPVAAAVEPACALVHELIGRLRTGAAGRGEVAHA